jgi:hypothetical protein
MGVEMGAFAGLHQREATLDERRREAVREHVLLNLPFEDAASEEYKKAASKALQASFYRYLLDEMSMAVMAYAARQQHLDAPDFYIGPLETLMISAPP